MDDYPPLQSFAEAMGLALTVLLTAILILLVIALIMYLVFGIGHYRFYKYIKYNSPALAFVPFVNVLGLTWFIKDDEDKISILSLKINYVLLALSLTIITVLYNIPYIGTMIYIVLSEIIGINIYYKVLRKLGSKHCGLFSFFMYNFKFIAMIYFLVNCKGTIDKEKLNT